MLTDEITLLPEENEEINPALFKEWARACKSGLRHTDFKLNGETDANQH